MLPRRVDGDEATDGLCDAPLKPTHLVLQHAELRVVDATAEEVVLLP